MKILHITKKYPNALGGDATAVSNLEKEQEKKRNKVFVLTTNCYETISKKNIIKFGLKSRYQDWDNISLKRFISTIILIFYSYYIVKKIKPDIVHSHSAELGFIFSFPCKHYGIPIINQCRGVSFPYPQNSWIRRKVEEFSLKNGKFKKIITVDANSVCSFAKAGINNVIYLPNGINLEQFKKKRNNKKKRKIIFIFVGRIEEKKGVGDLIEAIKRIKRFNSNSLNFEVRLFGDGVDLEKYEKVVEKYELKSLVKFYGKREHREIIKNYFESDIFVLPSHHEGFPNTLLESWGAGLPVIVTDVGGISKVCEDKKNAVIIKPRKIEELAKAMVLLMNDKDLREKIGRNGKKLVEKKYSWKKIDDELLKIYKEVLKENANKQK